jgi:hypothetical protein
MTAKEAAAEDEDAVAAAAASAEEEDGRSGRLCRRRRRRRTTMKTGPLQRRIDVNRKNSIMPLYGTNFGHSTLCAVC